jgi:hypothetical protein
VAQAPDDPAVTSVVPNRVNPGSTLDITVHGSGFDPGSLVKLERGGVPAVGITTNTTTYVSATQLVANITLAATVDTGRYDVAVTTSGGRKGVGIELLAVEYALEELQLVAGSIRSRAHAVNDRGEVVGDHCIVFCIGRAFYWSPETGLEELPVLPGYTRSTAAAINQRGRCSASQVFAGDPVWREFRSQHVRWDKARPGHDPVEGAHPQAAVIGGPDNNLDQCSAESVLVVQTVRRRS